MAEKTNANIGFEKQLWDAACVLWGHIPAVEYRKVIIGLIFLRYISSAFDKRYQELVAEDEGFEDDRDAYAMENVFLIADKTSTSEQERIYRCSFNLKSRKYSAADDYYLVISDEKGMQVTRENFQIDIAFAVDDFDFFSV